MNIVLEFGETLIDLSFVAGDDIYVLENYLIVILSETFCVFSLYD